MSITVLNGGAWSCNADDYEIDQGLGEAIAHLFYTRGALNVYDLGCGAGGYTKILRDHGIWSQGFDLNPKTAEYCTGCFVRDVTQPMTDLAPVEGVLSLEVGEHIPLGRHIGFLDNIAFLARDVVVLSWFPRKGEGVGHVNEQPNAWVIKQMEERGFKHLVVETIQLRTASRLWWFKESLLAFSR